MDTLDDLAGEPHAKIAGALVLSDGRIAYPLKKPVQIGVGDKAKTLSRAILSEPTGAAIRQLDRLEHRVETTLFIIQMCAKDHLVELFGAEGEALGKTFVDRLGTRDIDALDTLATDFFVGGQRTGTTGSAA